MSHVPGNHTRVWIFLLLFVTGLGVLWISAGTRATTNVSVRFSGYTNDVSVGLMAAFEIRNDGKQPIQRWALHRCVANSVPQPFSSLRTIAAIPAGGSERILVSPPTGLPWKATFTYSAAGWRPKLYVGLEKIGLNRLAARTANSFQVELVESAWIEK